MRILTPGLTFDAEKHRYYLDGVRVPGVTSVLRGAGFIDDEWFTEEGRERGNAVHAATHFDDEGDLDETSVAPLVFPYLRAWRKFRRETGFMPLVLPDGGLACELAVASRIYGFATTVDRVGFFVVPRILVVLEIKSGSLGAAALQTAGQALALQENGVYIGSRFAVRLKPDGDYNLTPRFPDDLSDREDWCAALRVVRRLGRTEDLA